MNYEWQSEAFTTITDLKKFLKILSLQGVKGYNIKILFGKGDYLVIYQLPN